MRLTTQGEADGNRDQCCKPEAIEVDDREGHRSDTHLLEIVLLR